MGGWPSLEGHGTGWEAGAGRNRQELRDIVRISTASISTRIGRMIHYLLQNQISSSPSKYAALNNIGSPSTSDCFLQA